jgi:hypothetical protein
MKSTIVVMSSNREVGKRTKHTLQNLAKPRRIAVDGNDQGEQKDAVLSLTVSKKPRVQPKN